MRSRSEDKRQHILEQAAVVFRETGYERASMAEISSRVGGSKTTLYGYFKSKQELFATVMVDAMKAQGDALMSMIDPSTDDPRSALIAFGAAYLDLVLSKDILSVTRIGIAESGTDGIGGTLYELGPRQGWHQMSNHLQDWTKRGLLRAAPPTMIALHLRGLLEAGLSEPALYGAQPELSRREAIEGAVDAFLRAYGA